MKNYLILILLFIGTLKTWSQRTTDQSIEDNRNYEYINVQTDRDLYLAGDRIWYKLYLGNNQNNANDLSVVAYVELIDLEGHVLLRNKNKCIDGMSHGSISIPKEMNSSVYVLKAYTLWMNKFDDNLSFKKEVLIAKEGDSVIQGDENRSEGNSKCVNVSAITLKTGKVQIRFSTEFQGLIVAQYRGVILSKIEVKNPSKTVDFEIQNTMDGPVVINLFDLNGNSICESKQFDETRIVSTLDLKVNSNVRPREEVSLELVLKNNLGKNVKGNFSISIHRDWKSLASINLRQNLYPNPITVVNKKEDKLSLMEKELFLYPKITKSLPSIVTNQINQVQERRNSNQIFLPEDWKDFQTLVSAVNKSYNQQEIQDKYEEIYLPFDNIYYPADYLALPNVEEFFIEIIDQIKFRRKKGKGSIAIRNTENKDKVFVYKVAPLIVIDGFIYDNLEDVLSIDPSQLEKLTLSWKANTLSKVSLVKLADNGVLALYTKNGIQSVVKNEVGEGIYEQYHRATVFPLERHQQKTIPDFREPLYWNPNFTIKGRDKIYFNTSDESGDFVIDVRGVSEDGCYLTQQIKFNVHE